MSLSETCLSETEIWDWCRWSNGAVDQLPDDVRDRVKQHLKNCPFCLYLAMKGVVAARDYDAASDEEIGISV